jgi:FMN phosphatase YigB (HAD superfamily)
VGFYFFLAFYHPQAWHLCDPNTEEVFKALRNSGVKLAVVSNFDTRLRPLLRALNCDDWFDAVAVSAEVSKLSFSFYRILFYQFVSPHVFHFPPHLLMHASISAWRVGAWHPSNVILY